MLVLTPDQIARYHQTGYLLLGQVLSDAMLEARDIDARLPKIIYLMRRDWSLRAIGKACKISHQTVDDIAKRLTPSLLKRCGLRAK
jgi:hypothetical protein